MNVGFISSLNLERHPLLLVENATIRKDYYNALGYFTLRQKDDTFVKARLDDFANRFNIEKLNSEEKNIAKSINNIVNTRFRPWRKRLKYWLLCDIALILLEDQLIINAEKEMKSYTSKGQQNHLNILLSVLFEKETSIPAFRTAVPLIEQYQINRRHANLPQKKFVITANVSAGKSTLINALMGKPLAKTSEEACTDNVNYYYSKPFEDGAIHYSGNMLTLHAGVQTLTSSLCGKESSLASFFRFLDSTESRFCIVDTPGVNSAINKNHGSISKEVLQSGDFDKVIYVLNASKLGTDEELGYIRWVSENVPHEKVIFVLNKLDNFKTGEDDIYASIDGLRKELIEFFECPVICPLSARYALLLKMKFYDESLTPDEEDEYEYFTKKFKKPEYDLSKYYDLIYPKSNVEAVFLSEKCGIYGLEKMMQGGDT